MIPPTRYAQSHAADIAFKVVSDGPRDIVLSMPFASHLDMLWELPEWAAVMDKLSNWGRLIVYDRRGTGLSDRQLTGITAEVRSDDVIAVLDAAGSAEALLVGHLDTGAIHLLTAARYPDRVSAVVAGEVLAAGFPDEDHPFGVDEITLKQMTEAFRTGAWGQGVMVRITSPELELTPQQVAWMARYETMSATPSTAAQLFEMNAGLDLRPYLRMIQGPVLLIHDLAFTLVPTAGVQWLADRLPTATLKLINTSSVHGTGQPLVDNFDEIEEFLFGTRVADDSNLQVATLLMTDLVGSTRTATAMGDRRWKELLTAHRRAVRASFARFGGTEIDTAGDGFLATFALPSAALRCARQVAAEAVEDGVQIHAGVHTGEILLMPPNVVGIAVHVVARVATIAGPQEVLFTDTVRSLTMGSGIAFEPAGEHTLRGVPGSWSLYRLTPPAAT